MCCPNITFPKLLFIHNNTEVAFMEKTNARILLYSLVYCLSNLSQISLAQTPPYTFPVNKKITQFLIKNYDTEDGLPSNRLKFVFQDTDGYLWITSYEGITRFDGFEFKIFSKENVSVFSSNVFLKIDTDSDNTIWFTTEENGLVSYRDKQFYVYGSDIGYRFLNWALNVDSKDRVWSAASNQGCFYFQNGTFYSPPFDSVFNTIVIVDIIEYADGDLYIGTHGNEF